MIDKETEDAPWHVVKDQKATAATSSATPMANMQRKRRLEEKRAGMRKLTKLVGRVAARERERPQGDPGEPGEQPSEKAARHH